MEETLDNLKVAFLSTEVKKKKTKERVLWYNYTFWKDDPETKNICGRDFLGWLRLWTLYFVMYATSLLLMTGLLIVIMQLIISDDRPYVTGMDSPLQLSPGLGMRPRTNFKTALIRYAASDPQTYMPYVQNIRTFVYLYEEVNIKPQDGFATCEKTKTPDDVDLVCKFYPIDMGVCVKENNYGYDRSQPCVVLKINKVYGWLPDIINATASTNPLVRCYGQTEEDLEFFGTVRYFPNVTIDGITYGYFSNLYFPYLVQVAYRSPLVAVQFENPKRHALLMVQCQLFNIRNPGEPLNFELLVD
ncbi:Sodium:potassium dependent atpase beta subunit [Fasciola gigantica]|uniref:Sodium:potassium dependent atpase beta subunit n=1 Tax=Fasciola gigantica TaxID=46835 RepID=A0A504YI51_FASGI|nr:Sodium:potassium dependent atpase beta subunit [Fasciola gigantica]